MLSVLRNDLMREAANEQGLKKALRRTKRRARNDANWRESLDVRIRYHHERQAMFLTAANAVVGLAPID